MLLLTMTTTSLATRVNISTQDTVDGQALSRSAFMISIVSYPLAELRFGAAFFSPLKSFVSSRSTDPSQPCQTSNITVKDRHDSIN